MILLKKVLLLIIALLVILIVVVEAVIFLRVYRFPFISYTFLGATYSLTHWFGWIGTIYIFIASPAMPIIKRLAPKYYRTMLGIHMIGNLVAVLFVSIHFAQQLTRSSTAFPDLGTGIILYAVMIMLVSTGIVRYYGVRKYIKQVNFLHASFAVLFYVVIIVHILQGISVI
jgi:uncharacterized membrane protein YidH (DUF202 family)